MRETHERDETPPKKYPRTTADAHAEDMADLAEQRGDWQKYARDIEREGEVPGEPINIRGGLMGRVALVNEIGIKRAAHRGHEQIGEYLRQKSS